MQDVVCMSAATIMQVSQKCAYKVSNSLIFTASTVQIKEFLEIKSDLQAENSDCGARATGSIRERVQY